MSSASSDSEDERDIIEYYFARGFQYNAIVDFLSKRHGISMSERTLRSRLNAYGLRRRSPEYNLDEIRGLIQEKLRGPACMGGYRSMWHALCISGHQVPRNVVEQLMRELDPEGCQIRKARRLRRRTYRVPGPNHCWHTDGYDKLKPYGFPIHGCIDGWSRKIIWLRVARSNNNPIVPGLFYVESVAAYGCPVKLRSDCGTENGVMAALQCEFRSSSDAHFFGTSPANQRIESWWSQLRRSRSTWWMNYFKDMIERGHLNTDNGLEMECLWICFSSLIQKDLDLVKEQWNTHRIRASRHDTVAGIPDELYHLPERHGGVDGLALNISEGQINFAKENFLQYEVESNMYEEYFGFILQNITFSEPENWEEAENMYFTLMSIANNTD
jgi:hypothetical protein